MAVAISNLKAIARRISGREAKIHMDGAQAPPSHIQERIQLASKLSNSCHMVLQHGPRTLAIHK